MSGNHIKVGPRQARRLIIECFDAGVVPFLQSSPGIGKSSIHRSIAEEFDLELIDHRLSTSEPTDMTGLPRFGDNGRARFAPFEDLFPLEGDPLPVDQDGRQRKGWLLFLDEANSADRRVQAASYKLVLDRMVGRHRLHENCIVSMAGNLATDRAIVNPLSTAMQSRLAHIEMEVVFQEWLEDVALKEHYDSRIIAFLSQFPDKLMDFKPDHQERTFACPRTWEFVNKLISIPVVKSGKLERRLQKPMNCDSTPLLTGVITSGVAMEFVKFTEVFHNMISIEEILKNPDKAPVPTDNNLKWAVVTVMMEHCTKSTFSALATYADRFDLSFRLLFYRSVLVRSKDLRTHPDFGNHIRPIVQYLHETPGFQKS